MKYKILIAANPSDLEKQVNELIDQGYQPNGDLQVSRVFVAGNSQKEQHINCLWAQPMVLATSKRKTV